MTKLSEQQINILAKTQQYRYLALGSLAEVCDGGEAGSTKRKSFNRSVARLAERELIIKTKLEGVVYVAWPEVEEALSIDVDKEAAAFPLGVFTWKPENGVVKNCWERPPFVNGHRCLWSCEWYVPNGVCGPEDLGYQFNNMSKGEIVAELRDVAARGSQKAMLQFVLEDISVERPDNVNMYSAEHIIGEARKFYYQKNKYLCPWNLPSGERFLRPAWRPGWSTPEIEASFRAGGGGISPKRAKHSPQLPGQGITIIN